MKRIISAIIASTALLGAHTASAQTFVTTPGTYTFSGTGVAVQKGGGPLLDCNLSIDIVNTGGVLTAQNSSLTNNTGLPFCTTVTFQNAPWAVTVSGSTVTVSGIYVNTSITPGDCSGFLAATFSTSGATEQLSLDTGFTTTSTLPQVSSGGDCKIDGVLEY